MTITDKTKAGPQAGGRAMSFVAAAVDPATALTVASADSGPGTAEMSSGIASTSDMHGVAEDARTGGENRTADDVVEDAGSSSIPVGSGAPVGEDTLCTDAPREIRRQGRRARQQRPDTKASASSPSMKVPAGKNARIAKLVSRQEGAGIDELMAATGWQRHTVRAALTRLRQSGFIVDLRTGEDGVGPITMPLARRGRHECVAEARS